MWETRGETQRHTTSLLMAWVAIERMIRVARQRGLPGDIPAWSKTATTSTGRWSARLSDRLGSFVQAEGADAVDAGLLLMPMVKFVSPIDPRFLATLETIEQRLVSDSLVFRYDADRAPDGLTGEEGTFSLCSFWYVEALTRVGRLDDARLALEKMFTYANHLGLYAEQIRLTGDQLGKLPPGLHPPRADQRRLQPRPPARLSRVCHLGMGGRGSRAGGGPRSRPQDERR